MSNILFSESDKYFETNMLDEVQRRIYDSSLASNNENYEIPDELKPLFKRSDEIKAKYKIQIFFGPKRKTSDKNLCMVHVFESGGHYHEHQDQLCYFCWDIENRNVGCRNIIPASKISGSVGWCDTCKAPRATPRMTEFIVYNLPTKIIADNVYKLFRALDSDADIYIKHAKNDIRKLTEMGDKGLKDMRKVEEQRDAVIYPLKHILTDVSNGSNIAHKIDDFLRA